MFQTISIMAYEDINYLHNTKEGLISIDWEEIVSAHKKPMALNG